jgi:hypothetical protein
MNTPFSLTTTLIPVLVARLSPIAALGVAVQGLPDSRRESGFVANDAVTLAWIAWSPVQGAGNSVSGAVTQTITLNCRISVRKLSLRDQVADLLYQRLAGWQVRQGTFLQYGGSEIIPPADNDPDYRQDVRFAMVVQNRPG